jgi:hypothetical protein
MMTAVAVAAATTTQVSTASRTPPSAASRIEEDQVQMTFDTDFEKPPPPPPKGGDLPGRPPAQTSQSVPAIRIADPWADPDDEDFGKEQEISMTFA